MRGYFLMQNYLRQENEHNLYANDWAIIWYPYCSTTERVTMIHISIYPLVAKTEFKSSLDCLSQQSSVYWTAIVFIL